METEALQDLVDDLAARIGLPVSLEDRRWRLLAYSALAGPADRVRRDSILSRAAPADVVAHLDGLALDRAEGVVAVPAAGTIGMAARLCVPVRAGGTLFGFLWAIPGDGPAAPDAATLEDAAARAGELLHDPRVTVTPHAAWGSFEASEEVRTKGAEEVVRALRGERPHYAANTVALAR